MATLQATSVTGSLTLGNTPNTSAVGYIWFDSSNNQLKYTVDTSGTSYTFSTGGAPPHPSSANYTTGNSKAALSINSSNIYQYNGTSWSTSPNVASSTSNGYLAGTANSAIFGYGGFTQEHYWDGLSFGVISYTGVVCSHATGGSNNWLVIRGDSSTVCFACCVGLGPVGEFQCEEVSNMNEGARFASLAGTSWNAAIKTGGFNAPARCATTEEFNGTSWSAGPNMINVRSGHGSSGTQNDAWVLGSSDISNIDCTTEYYNGTSWSSGPAITCYYNSGQYRSAQGTAGSGIFSIMNNVPYITCEINAPYTGTIVTCTC